MTPINRATNLVESYLKNLEIPYKIKDLDEVKQVTIKTKSFTIGGDLAVTDLLSKDPDRLQATLHTITEAAGLGKPQLTRKVSKEKTFSKDDFEKVYLRVKQFARTCNPKPEELIKHNTLLRRISYNMYRKFAKVFSPMGFDADDLFSISQTYLVYYLNYYGQPKAGEKNYLGRYIKQRLYEIASLVNDKSESTSTSYKVLLQPCNIDVPLENFNPVQPEDDLYSTEPVEILVNDKVCELKCEDTGFITNFYLDGRLLAPSEINSLKPFKLAPIKTKDLKRKTTASLRKILYDKLYTLPVDQRTVLLEQIISSHIHSPDTRNLAKKIYEERWCNKCECRVLSGEYCLKCKTPAVYRFTNKPVELKNNEASKLTNQEIEARCEALRKAYYDTCPDEMVCTGCKQLLPKASFGTRIPRDKVTGLPTKAIRQPLCYPCKRKPTK